MKIALDYDKTYTLDPLFWDNVMRLAEHCGHEVFCVTMRKPIPEETVEIRCPVHYTSRQAKVAYAAERGLVVDVWVDDSPHWLLFDG